MIKPINNNLIVELMQHSKTESGLELSVREEDKHLRVGKVIAIAASIADIAVNDMIIFGEYAYDQLFIEGEYKCFLNYEDVVAIC